jgi:polar amino acid transport system permease protein
MRLSGLSSLKTIHRSLPSGVILDVVKYLLVIGATAWIIARGTEALGYNWQWYRIPQYLFTVENGRFSAGPLLDGLQITLRITGLSLIMAFCLGLVSALLRLSGAFAARALARVYVELIRNTPLLVQLFFIYFVAAPVFNIGRFTSAVLALSLFEGAYASEIFRAGILSVHKGQWEAARSLGMSNLETYRYVVLPQAVRRILPPLTGQAVSLVKDSALVSTIAIYDLTMQGRSMIAETYLTFEIWFTIAAIYLLITATLSLAVNVLENRLKIET